MILVQVGKRHRARIDDHDIMLDDDVAKGRNQWNVGYHGVREGKQHDAARHFGAEATTNAQLRLRTVLGYAGIDRARLPGRAKGTAGRRGRAEPWGAAFLFLP